MQLGVVFPTSEIGTDPAAIRDYAQAVEGLGYSHILVYDAVLVPEPSNPVWQLPYTRKPVHHEPIALLGFLAGCTRRVGLATAVMVLPQRQTVLVAKQAAEVDLLCGGRFRLGIGMGGYEIEFEALGQDFKNRGVRVDEQIALLRELWTHDVVTFHGKWHDVSGAGLNPMPAQRPIPIWFGGGAKVDAALRRIGRFGDGWFPPTSSYPELRDVLARIHAYAREAGRDPATIGIEGRVRIGKSTPDDWRREYASWQELGATHLAVNTMDGGFTTPAQHIRRLEEARATLP